MSPPLTRMRVLDLGRALSGPFCGMILGDLGADVIKVEPAGGGDMIRSWGPFDRSESVYYLSANRNKRSIVIDFRAPEGLRLLREMALKSDVIVENFKPGTLAKIGLDPEELQKQKPDLIIASISGFGSTGPMKERPGFDQIAQGYSGFMSVTGTRDSGPTRVGVAIGDLTSGMWLAIGVLAAWIGRQQGGRGGTVETSLLASLVGLLSVQGQRYLSLGEVADPVGNTHPVIAPYGLFHTADGDMNIAAGTQDMWLALCDVIGRPDLKSDSRFLDNAGRMQHREALRELIEHELSRDTRAHWTELLVGAGIPAGPINTISDAFNDPQVVHLGLVERVPHPMLGEVSQLSIPLTFGEGANSRIRRSPPQLGQHTREVLTEYGLDEGRIRQLEADRIVTQAPLSEAT